MQKGIIFVRFQSSYVPAVAVEKEYGYNERSTLIAVDKGMISCNSKGVGGS